MSHIWQARWFGAQNEILITFETKEGYVVQIKDETVKWLGQWMLDKPLPYVLRQIKPYGGKIMRV